MGKKLLWLSIKSLKRRWREITRACIATFLAVFFVTGILLFEENMYQWQIASNKERFGDWFVMETNTRVPNQAIVNHPFLDGYSVAESAVKLYDEKWKYTELYMGYLSPEFIKQGYIAVEYGRLPENDSEIVMDWNTLKVLGYSSELGQTVTMNYYDGDDENNDEGRVQEEYVLVGILESYTNVWKEGRRLPGAIVTRKRYEAFNNNAQNAYIYKLLDNIKTDDYSLVYKNLKKDSKSNPIYNDYLYEYKPWGTESVYSYMYIIIMVIGIAALTYQLISYKSSRKKAYGIMRSLGAGKSQITSITFLENVIIFLPAGLLGIGLAALAGREICSYIEARMGIVFYHIDETILLKGAFSIVVALVVEFISGRLLTLREVLKPKRGKAKVAKCMRGQALKQEYGKSEKVEGKGRKVKQVKPQLKKRNVTRLVSFRLTRANSLMQNFGIRVFSLAVCVVIIFCSLKIHWAYEEYIDNRALPDFVGYQDIEDEYCNFTYFSPYFFSFEKEEGQTVSQAYRELQEVIENTEWGKGEPFVPTEGIVQAYINGEWESEDLTTLDDNLCVGTGTFWCGNSKYAKNANTNLLEGFSEDFIEKVTAIPGVKDITYSAYESMRSWSWGGMSPEYMGARRLNMSRDVGMGTTSPGLMPYCEKYLYSTQYLNPTEELYDRLSKYMDKSMIDYEAFCKGEQILVFVDKNAESKYDQSIVPGTEIYYHYYELKYPNSLVTSDGTYLYASEEEVCYGYPYEDILLEYGEGSLFKKKVYDEDGKVYGMERISYSDDIESRRMNIEGCVSAKAAGVVYLTDEIKEEFSDLIVDFGYYTAIASTELGNKACEKQNDYMADRLNMELTDDIRYDMKYNQMTVTYDLSASFSATHNILARFCEGNGVSYNSLTEEKEVYRTQLINTFLQYGITMIAVVIINVLISVIISKNRLEARKERLQLLLRVGAGKSRLRRVCIIEIFRESLWCVFTLPLVLMAQYITCRRAIRKM